MSITCGKSGPPTPVNTDRSFEKVTRIEGVFSGTLSYIFNEFSAGFADGPAFSTVVRIARDKGYTVCLFTSSAIDDRPFFPLCPSDVSLLLSSLSPPSFLFGTAGFLGATPSRRPQRRRRRTQTDYPRASPLRARPAAVSDLATRRLCFRAHAVPDSCDALSLVRANGR